MAGLQLYRQSTIGDCLAEALDEMVTAGKIPGDLATKMMAEVCCSCPMWLLGDGESAAQPMQGYVGVCTHTPACSSMQPC